MAGGPDGAGRRDRPVSGRQDYVAGQAEGFSRALKAYVDDCLVRAECPLRGSLQDGLDQIGTLVERADAAPLTTSDPSAPDPEPDGHRDRSGAVRHAAVAAVDRALTRPCPGTATNCSSWPTPTWSGTRTGTTARRLQANPAIFCLDVPETRTPEQISAAAADLQAKFPPLGDSIGWGALSCSQWPLDAVMPRQALTAEGAAPILVLGTVDDPATPYEWAQALASQLSSGRLLTWQGTVHTAYHQGSDCIDDKVEAYLLSGTVPAEGARCE